jgi:hypothetical protein
MIARFVKGTIGGGMADYLGVIVGGAIALIASFTTVWLGHWLERRRRTQTDLNCLHELLGRQAAEVTFGGAPAEETLHRYLAKSGRLSKEMRKDPRNFTSPLAI